MGVDSNEREKRLRLEELNAISISKPLGHASEAFLDFMRAQRILNNASPDDRQAYLSGEKAVLGDMTLQEINARFLSKVNALTPEERKHVENVARAFAGRWQELGYTGIAQSMISLYRELSLVAGKSAEEVERKFPSLKKSAKPPAKKQEPPPRKAKPAERPKYAKRPPERAAA